MTDAFNIDLNDFSGGPHWLSGPGKTDRKAIYAKHRAKYLAEHVRVVNPVRPETIARLERALTRTKKRDLAKLVKIWNLAIAVIDHSELPVRDMIERELADTAAMQGIRVGEAMATTAALVKKVGALRTRAIKTAFRGLRDSLGNPKIMDRPLAQWAAYFAGEDIKRIDNAIRTGLIGGLDNTEIARQVVGSLRLRGIDGVTEITRQHISHLARVAIVPRKRRQSGTN